jgi:hypothetical protein
MLSSIQGVLNIPQPGEASGAGFTLNSSTADVAVGPYGVPAFRGA